MNNIRYKKFLLVLISIIAFGTISSNAFAKYNIDEIVNLYKFLHSNPELSWQEDKTASHLADILETYEFPKNIQMRSYNPVVEGNSKQIAKAAKQIFSSKKS